MIRKLRSPLLVLLAVSLAALACGPGGSPSATSAPGGAAPSTGGRAVTSVEGVKDATIFIVAEGSLYEIEGTYPNASWTGSGFIIDPSGIAVTNNHVVTGAARFKVYVSGQGEPYNARVLGVSECSDLAVIDIEGDGFPYLQWHEGPVDVSLDVYAAGFPLSDPEYTLTKGIVSKARADGDVPWASVNYVLEHDANIQPGNSGGPLIDDSGRVVGINYAGGFKALGAQYYAIAQAEALPVIERLRNGENVNSIGINGSAFLNEESGFSGIWVSSVASGSAADNAGVKPGDILATMEGISLGRAGTKGEYCDILKSHSPTDTLSIEVIRLATGEVLDGQLNGRELSLAYTLDTSGGGGQGGNTGGGASSGYIDVSDAYSAIAVEIPAGWSDTDGSAWMDGNNVIGATVSAAPDLQAYSSSWAAPGLSFKVSDDLATLGGYVQVLDAWRPGYIDACKLDGRYDYNDGYYRGKMDLFTNCGGPGGSSAMVLSAVPTDNSQAFIVLLEMVWTTPDEEAYAVHVLDTFRVIGTLP